MSSLSNKNILVGVTGGIAAYKSAEIVRLLRDFGADVRVIMTPAAVEFIRPLTLQALSGNPVHIELVDAEAEAGMGHIELARWADLLLVAPATANSLATLVHGAADTLLGAVYLATPATVAIAPAMNQGMWLHPANLANIAELERRGATIIGPTSGLQACGDVGPGRLATPTEIAERVAASFTPGILQGVRVIITAGPTREAIDPVRYISNHSSGKMGYALAAAAADAGATVTLISGPVNLDAPEHCHLTSVISANEMYLASMQACKNAHVFIGAAAVADYRCVDVSSQKIKKQACNLTLQLEKNIDIITAVGSANDHLYVVGFAAETENLTANAQLKLDRKQLNAIVANDVSRTDIGFDADDNEVYWITPNSEIQMHKKSKTQLARDLIQCIANDLDHRTVAEISG